MAHKEACELNGRKDAKDKRLRELLKAPNLRRVPRRPRGAGGGGGEGILGTGGGGGSVPMPLDPTVQVGKAYSVVCNAFVATPEPLQGVESFRGKV